MSDIGLTLTYLDETNPRLRPDCCIWCGENTVLSASHLFPKAIGGRFAPFTSCQKCNGYLGSKHERAVKDNTYLMAAMAKFNPTDRGNAYRDGEIIEDKTGVAMRINENGKAEAITRRIGESGFIGSPSQAEEFNLAQFRKKHPDLSTKLIKDFFADPHEQELVYAGETIQKEISPAGQTTMRIKMKDTFVHPNVIAKIAYEFMTYTTPPEFGERLNSRLWHLATVDPKAKERIVFADEISKRVIADYPRSFDEYRCKEHIPFENRHYIVWRLSRTLILYLEIVLFDLMHHYFIIDRLTECEGSVLPLVDILYPFPLKSKKVIPRRYDNLHRKLDTIRADAFVHQRFEKVVAGHTEPGS